MCWPSTICPACRPGSPMRSAGWRAAAAFAVRQLYTDQDEVLFEAARPIILNGIEDVVTRPDLADRAIVLTLPPISDAQRRPEPELWREFELRSTRHLGGAARCVRHGLRDAARVRLDRLPRMADFALWAAACETALWPAGTFARAYAANRRAAIEDAHRRRSRWPPACETSWPSAAPGRGAPPISCKPRPTLPLTLSPGVAPAGRTILGCSPAACGGPKPPCAHMGLRLPSGAKEGWNRIIKMSKISK